MVKILKLLFLLGALLPLSVHANAGAPDYFQPVSSVNPVEKTDCDLEAPSTITVEETGTTHISISWQAVAHAYGYNVRVWELVQGGPPQLVIDEKPVLLTNYKATNLKYATQYRLEVAPMCDEVTVSRKFIWIQDFTLIIDLMVAGYTALPTMKMVPTSCNTLTLNYKPIQPEYKWFDVEKTVDGQTKISRYTVWIVLEDGLYRLKMQKVPESYYSGNSWVSNYINNWGDAPPCSAAYAFIRDETLKVCEVDLLNLSPPFELQFTILNSAYAVKCLYPYHAPPGDGGVDPRSEDSDINNPTFVSNPFSEYLHIISTAQPADTPVTFYLIDSNGRLVMEEQRPAAQEYDLPTSQLPSGFYILKIRANQNTQTFKVIKF